MKKIILTAFIGLICLGASAQLASPISFGVHGGWTSTKMDVKSLKLNKETIDNISSSSTGGYMLGIFTRINLGKLYLQPELNYSKKEGNIDLPKEASKLPNEFAQYANTAATLSYSSIDIPILLGYKIIKFPFFNIHIFGGPVASFSTKSLDIDFKNIADRNFEDSFDPNKVMWNVKMGAGIEVWKLNLDVDYEMGLRKFTKEIKAPKVFNITLGLRLI